MNIDIQLKEKLESIDFTNRYIKICNEHSDYNNSIDNVNIEKINELFRSFSYPFKYSQKQRFYKLIEKVEGYTLQFNVLIKSGYIQLVWHIKQNSEILKLGWGMWESIVEEIKNTEFTQKPFFSTYQDLEAILKEAFSIYEDFKAELKTRTRSPKSSLKDKRYYN
jgi:hypothetical protein